MPEQGSRVHTHHVGSNERVGRYLTAVMTRFSYLRPPLHVESAEPIVGCIISLSPSLTPFGISKYRPNEVTKFTPPIIIPKPQSLTRNVAIPARLAFLLSLPLFLGGVLKSQRMVKNRHAAETFKAARLFELSPPTFEAL